MRKYGQAMEAGLGEAGWKTAFFACSTRLFEVGRVVLRQLARAAWRRAKSRPVRAPFLLLEALEQLSGSLLKFGQVMATQVEHLPREYCDVLMSLLDRVPPITPHAVRGVFVEELRMPPEESFRSFDYKPIASASIGQVHRATMVDGACVAVKVQRPGIRRVFERDLAVLSLVVRLVGVFRVRRLYFLRHPVGELARWTQDELDYQREAAYCAKLGENAGDRAIERVPKVFWELTTSRILTMEYLAGPSVADLFRMQREGDQAALEALRQTGFVPNDFAANVISNFVKGALRTGVFHADLHPANLVILPGNAVGYVDFGIVGVFTQEARRRLIELMIAYASGKPDGLYRGLLQVSAAGPGSNLLGVRQDIAARVTEWYHEPAISGHVRFRGSVASLMADLLFIGQRNGLLLDRGMLKYTRAAIVADGLVSRIAPDFDFAETLRTEIQTNVLAEDRQNTFSTSGVLSFLCDLTVWLESSPHDFLAAVDRLPATEQPELLDSVSPHSGRGARIRALCIAGIWVVSVLSLTLGGDWPSFRTAPVLAVLIIVFMTSWTVWLVWLLCALRTR